MSPVTNPDTPVNTAEPAPISPSVEELLMDLVVEGKHQIHTMMPLLKAHPQKDKLVELLITWGFRGFMRDKNYRKKMELKRKETDPVFAKSLNLLEETYAEQNQEIFRSLVGSIKTAVQNYVYTLFDEWTLSDGTKLGDATNSVLKREAQRERASADGHLKTADFYQQLARRLKGQQIVRDTINPAEVEAMRTKLWAQMPHSKAA